MTDRRRLEPLDVDECLRLLGTRYLGRIAYIKDQRPEILPVNYRLHEGAIVIRTTYGALLDACHLATVAFEVDEDDLTDRSGWSVVVQGRAEEIWHEGDLERARELPLRPWAPQPRDHYLRILPGRITGRRIS